MRRKGTSSVLIYWPMVLIHLKVTPSMHKEGFNGSKIQIFWEHITNARQKKDNLIIDKPCLHAS